MVKKKPPDEQNPDFAVDKIDPEVEAKIDAMMDPDEPKKTKKPASKKRAIKVNEPEEKTKEPKAAAKTVASAPPLLPDDKLPDFEATVEQENKPAAEAKTDVIEPLESATAKEKVSEEMAAQLPEPEPPLKELEETPKDEIGVEDRATEAAVEEIIAQESDRILAIDDAKAELTKDGVNLNKKSFFGKIGSRLGDFWANRAARRLTLSSVALILVIIFALPVSRYFTLNLFGVKASMSMKIIDDKTGQPLKNVEVSLSGKTAKTDIDGQVKIEKIKLGKQSLTAKKPAFADLSQALTVGLGSNPKGDLKLVAVGSRYSFEIKDFLSHKPVDAEAVNGEFSARANENGEIALSVEDENLETIDVEIAAQNYRTEKITLNVGAKEVQKIQLVPSRKHAFVSKRNGQYDLYKIDVDGKNEQLVLKGTGNEREESMSILSHETKDLVAFVSTRGEKFNKDGYGLGGLNIIDLATNETTKIAESERIQLIDFIGDKLVFVLIKSGESAVSPTRHRLVSYDLENGQQKELASTNYFNDVLSANGVIYYSPAEYKVNGQVGFYQIKPDGSNKYSIFSEEAWSLLRVDYNKVDVSVQKNWYEYNIDTGQFDKQSGAPASLKSRIYVDAPGDDNSAWVDDRDGKGVLLLHSKKTSANDKALITQGGLRNPIKWLDNNHIVYRASDNSETADYVVSIHGGEPKKIADVTNIAGLDRWYYY